MNILSLISYEFYSNNFFWISCFFGSTLISSVQNIAMVHLFKFCEISKYASYAILIFLPVYIIDFLIFGTESIANILFQLIIGLVALFLTLLAYIKKYPNCTITNYIRAKQYSLSIWNCFIRSLAKNNFQCETALEEYKHQRKNYHAKRIN